MTRREMLFKAMKGAKWNTWAELISQKMRCYAQNMNLR
jgi:hypothetical protein